MKNLAIQTTRLAQKGMSDGVTGLVGYATDLLEALNLLTRTTRGTGMFLAVAGWPPLIPLLTGTLGIGLAASSAAAINHLLDHRIDAQMARTKRRPLASGKLTQKNVLVFALALGLLSMLILILWVNPLTAMLTFLSLFGYAIVYTVWLKRATPQNIVIGGAAGAAPPVLGWTAVTGSLDPHALLLFLIIFVWTPPHFWALAIYRKDEYALVDIPMLPVTHGVAFTRLQNPALHRPARHCNDDCCSTKNT